MVKKNLNLIISLVVIVSTCYISSNRSNIEGLTVKFRKVSEDYVRSGDRDYNFPYGTAMPVYADEGWKFVKLKLKLKNEGKTDCIFNFNDIYLSTEQDSLYRRLETTGISTGNETKIKPGKEIKRTVLFEFPDKATPKELFIEDKRYAVIEE